MPARRERAVTAGLYASGDGAVEAALNAAGYALAGRARDGASALAMIRGLEPALVLADAVLPGADGIALAERVRLSKLDVQPAILLARLPGLRLPGEARLEALGAAWIDRPPTADAVAKAAAALAERPLPLPERKRARLEALMDALGIPDHPGRACLARAVALAWGDRRRLRAMKASLYPAAARPAGLSPEQAERAIRYVIDAAWRTGHMDQQQAIFGYTIDARRGRPTCGEMIAQLADILRWEG